MYDVIFEFFQAVGVATKNAVGVFTKLNSLGKVSLVL